MVRVLLLCCMPLLLLACRSTPEAGSRPAVPSSIRADEPIAHLHRETSDWPHLFAPGTISSASPEFATSYTPDGRTVFFNRATADRDTFRILFSTWTGEAWSEPKPLPFSDGTYRDIDPFVSLDGERLYFSSTRPRQGDESKDYDTWYVERTASGWGDPVNPGPPLNGADDEVFVTEARGGTLYFTVFREDGRAIHRASRDGDGWATPVQVEFDVPDSVRLSNPVIAPDESFVLVVTGQLDAMGGGDIFVSRPLDDGRWSRPENLGATVNSEHVEFAPALSPDGAYLFFTSERPGVVLEAPSEGRRPGDLYQAPWPPGRG